MDKKTFLLILTFATFFCLKAGIEIDLESGGLFSGYNDVRIPGDEGTLFSLSEELETDPSLFFRMRLTYSFNPRHHLGILIAPLEVESEGKLGQELVFMDAVFPADTSLKTTYRFNSYRLTYRYDFLLKDKIEIGAGFTAKIRDAEISVRGAGLKAEKTNLGFVPILNFRLHWKFTSGFGLLIDGDALAAPQGRAEDVMAALTYRIGSRTSLKAGYRILEGGADNDEVYSFALFHYALLGVMISF